MASAGHAPPAGRQGRERTARSRLADGSPALSLPLGTTAGPGLRVLLPEALPLPGRRRQPERGGRSGRRLHRSEEHTSDLQSLMRISYAVFFLKKIMKNKKK